jgi:hypothetical protein
MLRRVALVRADVSEERSASIIRVTRIGETGTRLATTSKQRTLRRYLPSQGESFYEFFAQEQTVNHLYYVQVLTTQRESFRRKRSKLWPDRWILHHDNGPAHEAFTFRQFTVKKSMTKVHHPLHSSDLIPGDFWLFTNLKNVLKSQRFADIPHIQRNVTILLRGIPETQ